MQMRPDVQISSMIKALEDTILPAIPAGQGLAAEQGRLVVGMLKLMACQLPLQFAFDRDELSRLLDCCDGLAEAMAPWPEAAADLTAALQAGRDLLARCQAGPEDLCGGLRRLNAALAQVIDRVAPQASTAEFERLQAPILAQSREQLLRDRALMATQGWETGPGAPPDIALLLPADTVR
ncbi:hypothetical protein [Zavarzinia aquatilis]|uniref:Uncharacterized protein n=1 Tax=Zavarzinia aquatilis TaxID=2211142 RepID=A0A317EE32_9PROT|nr:hypothetical protein [Zavarzinia aquatilis]PWR25297.1 hypothetical protein DKG74_05920 [Zavarzinia aquatilis]